MTTASKKQLSNNIKAINFVTIMWIITILLTVPLVLWFQIVGCVIVFLVFVFGICFMITAYNSSAKKDQKTIKRKISDAVLIATIVLIIYWLVIVPVTIRLFNNTMGGGLVFIGLYMYGTPIAIVILALALTFWRRTHNKPKLF